MTVVELMFTTAVIALTTTMAIPQVLAGLDRARAIAAARFLAQQCGLARLRAVSQGRYVALQFTARSGDYGMQLVADGNRNGVRAADIAAAIDRPLTRELLLGDDYPGVRLALDPTIGLGSDPIRLGGTPIVSFSPEGTATAGSVYLLGRDGSQFAVRVLGVTGRTRVLRYNRRSAAWEEM